jgi:regulatory protein
MVATSGDEGRLATIDALRALMARPADAGGEPGLITDLDQARQIGLNYLAHRARTAAELSAHLVSRGVETAVADQVVERFVEVRLLDDAEFARQWVTARRARQRLADARLRRELLDKGVDPDTIAAALEAADQAGGPSQADLATAWAIRRLGTMAGLDRATATRRLSGQLARRGYPGFVVRQAVERAWASQAGGEGIGTIGDDE